MHISKDVLSIWFVQMFFEDKQFKNIYEIYLIVNHYVQPSSKLIDDQMVTQKLKEAFMLLNFKLKSYGT